MAGAAMVGQTSGKMTRMSFRSTGTQLETVRSVAAGVVTLEITDLPATMTMSAGDQARSTRRTASRSVVRMTDRGRFLSRKSLTPSADGGGGDMDSLDALFGLNFPERDLKPGDTWEDTLSVGEGARAKQVHVTWKYLARVTFRGRDCARISATMSLPMSAQDSGIPGAPPSQGRISGSVVTYFDPKSGQEVYSSGSVAMVAKADLTALSQEAGEVATVTKINLVQSLLSTGR